ncbi:SAM-dependent methyltransferase [hydrothermal vent metagenome]|uniref:SAM-dependent methyltransferase n=1 Tax=hydrothermal vent metagenome TaxID=652676 RepID=A0A3B1BWE9_9ZZZZ
MTRNEKILFGLNKEGIGIEIGASHRPVAPKKDGYHVHIIDHLDKDGLIEKYKAENISSSVNSIDNIEEVDFVWTGQGYTELTGKTNHYDWVIAAHVIEHSPDLIAFLNNCGEILKEGGILSLAIPDKRYCFDRFRPISSLSKVIDAHLYKLMRHSLGTVVEYRLNSVTKDGVIGWSKYHGGEYKMRHAMDDFTLAIEENKISCAYTDYHAWCFTPSVFRLLIHDLNMLGYISFSEVSYYPTSGCEFYVSLRKSHKKSCVDRLKMLGAIEHELENADRISLRDMLGYKVMIIKGKLKRFLKKIGFI